MEEEQIEELRVRFLINDPGFASVVGTGDEDAYRHIAAPVEQAEWWGLDVMNGEKDRVAGAVRKGFNRKLTKAQKVITGAAVLSQDRTKVLLVQGHGNGKWSLPKGKVDEGETYEMAACREVFEETGVDISQDLNPDMKKYIKGLYGGSVVYFVSGDYVPDRCYRRNEVDDIRWFDVTAPEVPEALKKALKGPSAG